MEKVDPLIDGDVGAKDSRIMHFMGKTIESETIRKNPDSFVPELDENFSNTFNLFRGSVPTDIKLGFE